MSNRPTPSGRDQIQRKIKPQKSASISPTAILGAALVFVIFLVVAVIIATGDDLEEFVGPTPTTIPAPEVAGGALQVETLLYLTEDTPFSIVAAPDNENEEFLNETCAEVQVQFDAEDGDFFYLDDSTEEVAYWVFARRTDDSGWNGWLPLDVLAEEAPSDCASEE